LVVICNYGRLYLEKCPSKVRSISDNNRPTSVCKVYSLFNISNKCDHTASNESMTSKH